MCACRISDFNETSINGYFSTPLVPPLSFLFCCTYPGCGPRLAPGTLSRQGEISDLTWSGAIFCVIPCQVCFKAQHQPKIIIWFWTEQGRVKILQFRSVGDLSTESTCKNQNILGRVRTDNFFFFIAFCASLSGKKRWWQKITIWTPVCSSQTNGWGYTVFSTAILTLTWLASSESLTWNKHAKLIFRHFMYYAFPCVIQ